MPVGCSMEMDVSTLRSFLPDGPIGWSYVNVDNVTGPLQVFPAASMGVLNTLDVYTGASFPVNPGTCLPPFTLGFPFGSTYLAINENNGLGAFCRKP